MKYKKIYTEKNIKTNIETLYGIFHPLGEVKLQGSDIKNDTTDNIFMFGEVDEQRLYKDAVEYGRQLYNLLQDEIKYKLNDPYSVDPYDSLRFYVLTSIKENKIDKCFDICKGFVYDYNLPFDTLYYAVSRRSVGTFHNSLVRIVNYLVITFMFHILISKLSQGYDKYTNIYHTFGITKDFNDEAIFKVIIKNHNNFRYIEHAGIGTYKLILIQNKHKLFPVRYTNNLFTFVHEVITNNLCAFTFYDFDDFNIENKYTVFKRCSGCLKTLSKKTTTSETYKKIPIHRELYCDNCKKKRKREASQIYEDTLREIYDNLKSELPNLSNPELISKIKNLPPKDKVKKKYLEELQLELDKEKVRT